jgi:ABC-type phosphate/phosphonate transport system substrate-binding protein
LATPPQEFAIEETMKPFRQHWTLALLATVGVMLTAAHERAAAGDGHTVHIGLASSLFRDTSETVMQIAMRPFKSLLETQTGVSGHIVSGGDAEQLGQRLKEGEVHLGIFPGVEFAWAKAKFPELKPLLLAVNKQSSLRAHLIVRADNKINNLDDLKGRMVGVPNLSREHCWLFLQRRCVPADQTADKFFARIKRPRDASYAIDRVIGGALQAAVIDEADLVEYRKEFPEFANKVKTLIHSETFPCGVIAYYPGTCDENMIDQLRSGMLSAKDRKQTRQMLQMCRISRFEEVPDDFNKTLEDIAKAYPPPAK